MTHIAFFIALVAASLSWSAVVTAAAGRVQRRWLHRLLIALAVAAPVLALLPWLAASFMLAFTVKLQGNWFGPMLTTFLSAMIGGGWITRAGLRSPVDVPALPPAAHWPLVRLGAAFLLAKTLAGGTLLILDSGITTRAPGMKAEAVELIKPHLPPVVSDTANAAPLYEAAFKVLDADDLLKKADSPLDRAAVADVRDAAVTSLLVRHKETLAVIRQAAGRDVCRFVRDWSRPSIDLLLPELSSIRQAARLLQLTARRKAATGDATGALDDVILIDRIGKHAAAEPILVSGLVGIAIDSIALNTLAQVLPELGSSDLSRLDGAAIRDLLHVVPSFKRHFFGEEAFGISVFAAICDGGLSLDPVTDLVEPAASSSASLLPFQPLVSMVYRVFLLPEDIRAYRSTLRAYQNLLFTPRPFSAGISGAEAVEDALSTDRRGLLTRLLAPSLSGCLRQGVKTEALHRIAAIAVAATRSRITTGSLPESLDDLGPELLPLRPADPFTSDAPLLLRKTDTGIVIYSVGPDGEDDGGPPDADTESLAGNDDVGLHLLQSAPRMQ